jgi:endonuclease G
MEFNVNAYNETFLTSNIAPQDHERWNLESIEQKIRFWADKYKGLYIYWWGFAIPKDKKQRSSCSQNNLQNCLQQANSQYKMIAFLIPNKSSEQPLFNYVVSVDLIEQKTGIDFSCNEDSD